MINNKPDTSEIENLLNEHYEETFKTRKTKENKMKKTMTNDQALRILSEIITYYFEIRGKTDDKEEINWRKQVEAAEDLINKKLNIKEVA
jgi:CHASE3 domain sensor protein